MLYDVYHIVGSKMSTSTHFAHAPRAILLDMEPKSSTPEYGASERPRSPESQPNLAGNETSPEVPLNNPERGPAVPERSGEQSAQAQAALAAQQAQASISLPAPIPVQAAADDQTVSDDLPAVAADDDLIEKEWVDKAKKIISDTRDDPARREKEVSRLQADYLKKRYGKQLGAAEA